MLDSERTADGSDVLSGLGALPQAATVHVYDHVYRLLRHAVLAGDIEPGTRLVEADLAGRLQISRTPVRDALRRLESDGLAQRMPGGGLRAVIFTPAEISDIFRVRTELDQLAARMACERTGAAEWESVRELVDGLGAAASKFGMTSYEFSEAHHAVHFAIYSLAFTGRVAQVLSDRVLILVDIASDLSYAQDRPDEPVVDQHLELIEALASDDPDRAARAASEHADVALADAAAANESLSLAEHAI